MLLAVVMAMGVMFAAIGWMLFLVGDFKRQFDQSLVVLVFVYEDECLVAEKVGPQVEVGGRGVDVL